MTLDEFKKNIAPYMKKGWVAMDNDCNYFWYNTKPMIDIEKEEWDYDEWDYDDTCSDLSYMFNIEPVGDWTKSLIEIG